MKTYTATYQLESPKTQKIWVPQFSDYKIGIAVTRGGEDAEGTLVVKDGSTTLSADAEKTSIWTTYTLKSQAPGYSELSIEWEDAEVSSNTAKFKLIRVVTDSATFETGGEGGGVDPSVLSDYATKEWTEEQISDFVTGDDLTGYAEKSELVISAGRGLSANGLSVELSSQIITDGAKFNSLSTGTGEINYLKALSLSAENGMTVTSASTPYVLGMHTLSGTYTDNGTDVPFTWKILANVVA